MLYGDLVSIETVRQVETPEATATYQPVAHSRVIEEIERSLLDNTGMQILEMKHVLDQEGKRYFGLMELRTPTTILPTWMESEFEAATGDVVKEKPYHLTVGIRNSHDKKFPVGLVVGSTVMVCDNLSFSGEVAVFRKHTRWVMRDLPMLVDKAVVQIGLLGAEQDTRFTNYQNKMVNNRSRDVLVMEAYRRRVINAAQIAKVHNEYNEPQHEEHGKSTWGLFNAFTEVLKPKSSGALLELPSKTQRLHVLLDEYALNN